MAQRKCSSWHSHFVEICFKLWKLLYKLKNRLWFCFKAVRLWFDNYSGKVCLFIWKNWIDGKWSTQQQKISRCMIWVIRRNCCRDNSHMHSLSIDDNFVNMSVFYLNESYHFWIVRVQEDSRLLWPVCFFRLFMFFLYLYRPFRRICKKLRNRWLICTYHR